MTGVSKKRWIIIINLILLSIIAASSLVFLASQESVSAEPSVKNLEWAHYYSSSPYVRIAGTISNPHENSIANVTLWVDFYVDYACAHHMDALLKTERVDIGVVDAHGTVDFRRDISYVNDQTYFFRYIKYHLDWDKR